VGKLPAVAVGPYSDVYGLGKTCCYALFRTTQPLPKHWRSLPSGLADLLADCLAEQPGERPANGAAVLERLQGETAGQPGSGTETPAKITGPSERRASIKTRPAEGSRKAGRVRPVVPIVVGGAILGAALGAAVGLNGAIND